MNFKINVTKSKHRILELTPEVINELHVNVKKPVLLKFGCLSTSAKIVPMSLKHLPNEIKISKKILHDLRMPANIKLSLKPVGRQELRLGPVIGILTFHHVYENKRFDFYLNYVATLTSGVIYVFCSKAINPANNTIKGYYFNTSQKTWSAADFPYPDVVLDRCYPNAYRAHKKLQKVIGEGKIFNKKTMISKLDFYNALKEDEFLKNHLPETIVCTGASDIEHFLSKHHEIFIKPLSGMKGIGIIIVSLQNGILKCRYMEKGKVAEKKLANLDQVFGILRDFGHPNRRYIIQNSVPRMNYQGTPFCFRVMVCKNGNGQWLVPAIFTKAATGDSFLTNHASGARFVSLKNLFNDTDEVRYKKPDCIKLLADLGVKTAQVLDNKYGPLGDLGLDIILDRSGKPWLIEANGNPGTVPRSHMVEFPDWIYQSFKLPMAYARYLADLNN